MPHPFPLASVFTNGMRRDVDRTELPGGSAYNMVDFIPDEIQAVTGGRGGWTYAGPVMSGATQILDVSYAPFSAGAQVVAHDSTNIWNVLTGASIASGITQAFSPPVFHRNFLIFPGNMAGGGVGKYDGTTVSVLTGGSYPKGGRATVYKDRLVLANDGTNQNRVWFSAAGDPTTWDLTFGYWDTTGAVKGLGATLNSILIFHNDSVERLRGTTPPPGSDMVLEPFLPNVGCIDPFTIAYWNNRIVWASSQGIHMSDGATMVDLTASAQMKTYWQSLMVGYDSTSWRIAAGIYRDHYIICVNNGSGILLDCLCLSLNSQTMWRFSNIHGSSFARTSDQQQEKLYMGEFNAGRVVELSSLWSPSATVKRDADGTNPTPIIETGMFRGFDRLHRRWIESMGKQKWRFGYVDYDLRDAASDNPTATLSYCTDPTGSYAQAGLSLPATTKVSRVRRSFSPTQGGATHSQMLGLKYAVTGPYASAKLVTLEGDFSPIEIGAL